MTATTNQKPKTGSRRAPERFVFLASLVVSSISSELASAQVKPLLSTPSADRLASEQPESDSEREVLGVGRASIHNGDELLAREVATRAAYADAVAQGSGVSVGSLTIVSNIKAISDLIVAKSVGRITRFEVLGGGVDPAHPSQYEVRIRALVRRDNLTEQDDIDSLRLYLRVLGNPRILILLPQYTSSVTEPAKPGSLSASEVTARSGNVSLTAAQVALEEPLRSYSAASELVQIGEGIARSPEYAVAQSLARYGYQVVTSDDLIASAEIEPKLLADARRGVSAAALELARRADVDLVLMGALQTATSRIRPSGVDFVAATVEASAKALLASSGLLVDAFHQTSTRAHQNALAASATAIERIASDIAVALAWKIPSLLVENLRQTTLVLEAATMNDLDATKAALAGRPDIQSITVERIPSRADPRAVLRLQTGFVRVDAREILATISEALVGCTPSVSAQNRFEIRLLLTHG